jgi:hypothetical protein
MLAYHFRRSCKSAGMNRHGGGVFQIVIWIYDFTAADWKMSFARTRDCGRGHRSATTGSEFLDVARLNVENFVEDASFWPDTS